MNYDTAFYSERGGRTVNEDALSVTRNMGVLLAMAADGLGGMGDGEAASADAVRYLSAGLSNCAVEEDRLCEEILAENQRILSMHRDGKQMMTTIAVLWAGNGQTLAATVGDTRIYQFRSGNIVFQSTDHSVAQLAVFSGEITQDQIRTYPGRNRLLRALGADEQVRVELQELYPQPGDRLLICSDGFWELIVEREMLQWNEKETAEEWLNRMKNMAVDRCGSKGDNHSAIAAIVTEAAQNEG